ncbi:hypothetical protein LCGC14_3060720 [marine sediment metagenome]|uniref:Uncharacterized protein n=1 Tax=marine sediment metagenome TaxID=412755 RepID=A0A0F8Z9P4_9ZZZZ
MPYEHGVHTFFCEPTGRERQYLRRFVFSTNAKCPSPHGYHNARTFLKDDDETKDVVTWPHADKRWPTHCAGCDYKFTDDDQWQVFRETIYVRTDTRTPVLRSENIPGMMWNAHWLGRKGPDGRALIVLLPNGKEWAIDQRSSNCTLTKDTNHRCWIRKGEPPNITVSKDGITCQAGAGSIQAGDYHGFLRNGIFEP